MINVASLDVGDHGVKVRCENRFVYQGPISESVGTTLDPVVERYRRVYQGYDEEQNERWITHLRALGFLSKIAKVRYKRVSFKY